MRNKHIFQPHAKAPDTFSRSGFVVRGTRGGYRLGCVQKNETIIASCEQMFCAIETYAPGCSPFYPLYLHRSLGMSGWVYIMTNKPRGTLYVGVTNNLLHRIWQHREGVVDGLTKTHNLKSLAFFEQHPTMPLAIQREKTSNADHDNGSWI